MIQEAKDMGNAVRIQGVHHLCSVSMGVKANVSPCTEIEAMERRKKSKLQDGTPTEIVVSYLRCDNCGQTFSITYVEV